MSFRVLVIPEDPTYNGYILKPLVERMLAEAGKSSAKVLVLTNPKLSGYDDATSAIRQDLEARYGFYDLWLFLPDADRAAGLEELEKHASERGISLLCCAAQPEVEAWLLAGHRNRLNFSWQKVRSHHRLKEEVFAPFLRKHGEQRAVGEGRETLMRQTLQNFRSLLDLCPELATLQQRLQKLLTGVGDA